MDIKKIEIGKKYTHKLTGDDVLAVKTIFEPAGNTIKCRIKNYALVDFTPEELIELVVSKSKKEKSKKKVKK